jgi:DNA-binding NarL/FixJ family response regulator
VTPTRPWRTPTLVSTPHIASITARQADVLAGICHGHSNKEIGERLFMAEDSIKTLVRRLLPELGARTRAHAAALVCSEQVVVHVKETST